MFKSPLTKLGKSSTYALWYFLLVVALPTATLLIAGLLYFWQHNLLLIIVAVWLVVSALCYGAFIHWPNAKSAKLTNQEHDSDNPQTQNNNALPERLEPGADWSEQDIEIWNRCCLAIDTQIESGPDWQTMPDIALSQLALVSQGYFGETRNAALHFTVPELLLVISVASDRYRQLVLEHVPYIDKISVARANRLLQHKDNIQSSYSWFNRVRRTVRLINPASALVGELRDIISRKVLSQANTTLQSDLKRMLLQEVTQVGIELYSGKLKASETELASYQSHVSKNDKYRQFEAAEPLRILLIGQSSTGKSSLVNTLTKDLQAEVGVLPVTDRLTVHQLRLDDSLAINLIDTPSIDGSDDTTSLLIKQALEADLIIWLAKATQPARAPDQAVYTKLQANLAGNLARIPAPIIFALTHIDQLSPKSSWEPPYDLSGNNPKAVSIVAATDSAKTHIGMPDEILSIPLYLGVKYETYNTDVLAAQIMMLADTSLNVQRNRRRIELTSSSTGWNRRWTQAKKLSRVIGQSVVKRF